MLNASAALLTEPRQCGPAGGTERQSGGTGAAELVSLRDVTSWDSTRFQRGDTARSTAQPCPNMRRSLSSADPWHRIRTRMAFHPWLSKIKAFRAFFLPVPSLSDCISPQLSFPSFFFL